MTSFDASGGGMFATRKTVRKHYQAMGLQRHLYKKIPGDDKPYRPSQEQYWAVEALFPGELPEWTGRKYRDPWDAIEEVHGVRTGRFMVKTLGRRQTIFHTPEFLARVLRAPGGWFYVDNT